MNKISLYTLLILIFLGLSKGFSPSKQKADHLVTKGVLSHLFKGSPLSLIALDTFQAGFLIKTYYLKLRVIRPFQTPETIIVRTDKKYWSTLRGFQGMSIFRRKDEIQLPSSIPLPPGSLYIGNPGFGTWEYADSGSRLWKFHKAYRSFPQHFLWGSFRPSFEFFEAIKIHENNNRPFHGLFHEFGLNGSITQGQTQHLEDQTHKKKILFSQYLKNLITLPPWTLSANKVNKL